MKAHTPGPWVIEAAPNGYNYIRAKHRAEIAIMGSENMLADDSSAASNARLIAAAPDLLAALDAITYYFQQYEKDDSAKRLFEVARAAIAKASA